MTPVWFAPTFSGKAFEAFGTEHGAALAAIILCCVGVGVLARRPGLRPLVRWMLAAIALASIVLWYVWEWRAGLSSWGYSLPLQVCTATTILCVPMLMFRSYRLFEIVYFWGMAGATQALITPDIGPFGFPHFVPLQFFISHGVIWAAIVYMLVAEHMRPRWSSFWRAVAATLLLLALAGFANRATGGNYMYVAAKPPFPTLIDYLGPWPWYILRLVGVGIAFFGLAYLPFAIRDARLRRKVVD